MATLLASARTVFFGFVTASLAAGMLHVAPRPVVPELEIGYAEFVGRIDFDPTGPTAVTLQTPDGDVALLPNQFEGLVSWLAGREVEIEGLLLTLGPTPLLWIEAVRVVAETGERIPLHAEPAVEIAI